MIELNKCIPLKCAVELLMQVVLIKCTETFKSCSFANFLWEKRVKRFHGPRSVVALKCEFVFLMTFRGSG